MSYLDVWSLPGVYWFLAGLGAMLLAGWALCRIAPGGDAGDTALRFLGPASLYVLMIKSAMHALYAAQFDWSSGRLAPAVALLHGYPIYHGEHSGPVFNTIYPPMTYLAFLPAAFLGDPTSALVAGAFLSQLFVLGPVLALALAPHGDLGRTRSPLLGCFVFLGFWRVIGSTLLDQTLTLIHADAPALGFATLSLSVLYARRFEPAPSTRTLVSSAVFAALAVWTKQIYAPLFVVVPLWLLLANGPAAAIRASGWLAASLGATTAIFCGAFGARAMAFNILALPKSHPWLYAPNYGQGFQLFGIEQATILFTSAFLLLTMLHFDRRAGGASPGDGPPRLAGRVEALRCTLRGNYWVLFVAVAVSLVPFALLSRIKIGGHLNSYVHTLYFLSVAPCVLLLDWHARNRERGLDRVNVALKAALLVSPFCPLMAVNTNLLNQYNTLPPATMNAQEVAYRYALNHPGEAYFPWNPLSSLMAEGKAYHFEPGMMDRELGESPRAMATSTGTCPTGSGWWPTPRASRCSGR